MIEQNKEEIIELIKGLRRIAEPIGPLHSYWELIIDLELYLQGDTILCILPINEAINLAKEELKKRGR